MSKYYTEKRAQHYNTRWLTFNSRTLAETLAIIDITALRCVPERLGRCPRVLDVACGTGILLRQLLDQVPGIEAFGMDASADMLAQARAALQDQPHVHLAYVQIGTGEASNLPYPQESFDLITCTNALHDMPEPVALIAGLGRLLAPGGQLVVEDFAPRKPRFFWATFEWLLQRIEGNSAHAYTLAGAQSLCEQAGLHITSGKEFTIDWLWHGWVLRTELPMKPGACGFEVIQVRSCLPLYSLNFFHALEQHLIGRNSNRTGAHGKCAKFWRKQNSKALKDVQIISILVYYFIIVYTILSSVFII